MDEVKKNTSKSKCWFVNIGFIFDDALSEDEVAKIIHSMPGVKGFFELEYIKYSDKYINPY